jgi:DNA-binding MarR family transcriptional regulator
LSAAQLFVLGALQDAPGASLGELAERTFTDRTSVRAVVDRLASDGAVRTGRDPADRRRTLVHMTAAGRRRLDRAPDPPTVQLLIALRRLTREQLRRVTASLGTLLEAMELGDAPATMLFERGDAPARARGRRRVGRTTRAT